MDILTAVAIEFPCDVCGGRRAVSLRQVLLSQDMLHAGCTAPEGERECPPATFAPLMDRGLITELETLWEQLDRAARVDGGALTIAPPA